jgi:hypothetical protein
MQSCLVLPKSVTAVIQKTVEVGESSATSIKIVGVTV